MTATEPPASPKLPALDRRSLLKAGLLGSGMLAQLGRGECRHTHSGKFVRARRFAHRGRREVVIEGAGGRHGETAVPLSRVNLARGRYAS